jgi:hypothetical protein
MRKLFLGLGLLALNRIVSRRAPAGWRGLLSLQGLAGAVLTAAAAELLGDRRKPTPPQGA